MLFSFLFRNPYGAPYHVSCGMFCYFAQTRAEYKRYIIKVKNKQKRERRKKVLEKYLNSSSKFHIKCRKPVEDEIFDVDEYVKYLKERFKMNGKTGCVGPKGLVHISKNVTTVYISSKKPFPKRYIKYLTKRYLKRHGLRDYVRVISDSKPSLELRYFNIEEAK